ncbi:Vitamin B12 transporter BtuB [Saliniradius amylolyticus]|uniref:Vitamin B12 transporter BtuB n=1 Tax=Saliniradius amylolyticus TaxID=2183582 RepID=A0A2S2E4D4_9ALTE|nr:TonB-dependent receptor [Saliniradius amylolyticus]AWL12518.1 Vitamin B12 transporter BtuB [Saliniradius amylolyticus]
MLKLSTLALTTAVSGLFSAVGVAEQLPQDVEHIIVSSDFQKRSLQKLPSSLSIVGAQDIELRQAQHLEQILNVAPNVNFATGASRGRYIQIRGIGERSQFAEPINPSVGVIVDDMDFSGIAAVGTLFDVEQVEIFKGPQATEFGASALAGAIKIKTTEATAEQTQKVSLTLAQQDTWRLGAAIGGALTDRVFYRVALQQHKSDGFVENIHLNREDTNGQDELTGRFKLRYLASERLTLDLNYQHFDIDNGYDAFSLENNRQTRSDQPGFDRQQTHALGLRARYQVSWGELLAIGTHAESEIGYAYDEDWTFTGFHPWGYTSFDAYFRDRDTQTIELRASSNDISALFNQSTDWTLGVFVKATEEDLLRQYTYAASDFTSEYQPDNQAIYAETRSRLSERLGLTAGLRLDHYEIDYQDSNAYRERLSETMLGGKLVLDYDLTSNTMLYAGLYRGYKASGFNPDERVSAEKRLYDPEYNWNYELGLKWSGKQSFVRVAAFYMDRKDTQISDFDVQSRPDGTASFIDVIDNADLGEHQGLELESGWQVTDNLNLSANLGLLDASFEGYQRANGDFVEEREQAQSPSYMFNLALNWDISDRLRWHVEVDGKDEFYFSDGHNEQSGAYELVHASLSYHLAHWTLSLWGRNLTDETYYTRGFGGFNNDPREGYAPPEPYYQLGDGRRIGISAEYTF